MSSKRKKLTQKELEEFQALLLKRRMLIAGDVDHMHDSALRSSVSSASGELSTVPFHMADVGTDNFEHEFVLGLIENEEEELRQIDDALDRIKDGSYGLCDCGKPIPKARLRALPYAKLCIDCKRTEENGGNGGY